MIKRVLALGEGVAGAASLRDERVVLVLVGVLGGPHEQHVLQVVRQALSQRFITRSRIVWQGAVSVESVAEQRAAESPRGTEGLGLGYRSRANV